MNIIKLYLICLLLFFLYSYKVTGKDYLITEYGAKPDTTIVNTNSINEAIKACHDAGGGRVIIPPGIFKSGTIKMFDNVNLHLEIGATFLASEDYRDFLRQLQPEYRALRDTRGWHALIYAEGVSNIAITGYGSIDGNGAKHVPNPENLEGRIDRRPRNILFISCNNIRNKDVTFMNSGFWNQHYLNCEDVIVDRIKVYNHSNKNNDAIDIDGCRRFVLANSIFDTDDDGITLKMVTGSWEESWESLKRREVQPINGLVFSGLMNVKMFR